jgi:FKBP-type peptidyl-prolyl cis-trans isomerase FkpA
LYLWAALVLVVLLGWFVWPTPWRQDEATFESKVGPPRRVSTRTNRVTGQTYYLTKEGWVEAKGADIPPTAISRLEASSLALGELKTEEEKTLYALGAVLGKNAVGPLKVTPAELEIIQRGFADAAANKTPAVSLELYGPKVQAYAQARMAAAASASAAPEKEKGKAFADQAAHEPGAIRTPTGLVIQNVTAGKGKQPVATDSVMVHYRGTLIDGTEFDSSYKRGKPVDFALQNVIPCWTEALQLMKAGGKAKLVCPSDIAYGDRGAPPNIPPGATLVFEVELLEVMGRR